MGREFLEEIGEGTARRKKVNMGSRVESELIGEVVKIEEKVAEKIKKGYKYDYLVKKTLPMAQKEGDVELVKKISEMWMEVEKKSDQIQTNSKNSVDLAVYCGLEKQDIKRIEWISISEMIDCLKLFPGLSYGRIFSLPTIFILRKLDWKKSTIW
jgi:hypothetical protein